MPVRSLSVPAQLPPVWGFAFLMLLAAPVSSMCQQWTAVRLAGNGDFTSEAVAGYGTLQGGDRTLGPGTFEMPGVWQGTSGSWLSLLPAGADGGWVYGMDGGSQVGRIGITGVGFRAGLWHGTPDSFVNLHLPGMYTSNALAVSGNRQGGCVSAVASAPHATVWSGTVASAVDLNPLGAQMSEIHAMNGDLQGGYARFGSFGPYHAALWSGTAASFVDLSPEGSTESYISGMAPGQQVGWSVFGPGGERATLWAGTAASAVNLAPFNTNSWLYATTGAYQVGYSGVPGFSREHAGVWQGTAASFLDLHQFLPPGYSASVARSVTEVNGVLYVGGTAEGINGGEAFLWIGQVPSPSGLAPLLATGVLALRRRR